MKTDYYIFFSWQSDIKGNKTYIDKNIKKAVYEIKMDPNWSSMNITYDHSTMNRSGSPSVVETIHQKINTCDVFIADITPIVTINGKDGNQEKLIPNPNVMAESGFALRALGEGQIIMLMKAGSGNIKNLPFDIRHRRISMFDVGKEIILSDYLKSALETANKRDTNVFEKNIIMHDKKIYEYLSEDIGLDDDLLYNTNRIASSQKLSYFQSDLFYNIAKSIDEPHNQFLIDDINRCVQKLKDSILELLSFTTQYFKPLSSAFIKQEPATKEEKNEQNKTRFTSWIDKDAGEYLDEETYEKKFLLVYKFMMKNTSEIDQNYLEFRASIKKNLFI